MNLHLTLEMPDVCLSFVLLFTIFIIVVTQKLVLQQSKNVTTKCTDYGKPIAPSLYSISPCIQLEYSPGPSSVSVSVRCDRIDANDPGFSIPINIRYFSIKGTFGVIFQNSHWCPLNPLFSILRLLSKVIFLTF